MELADMPGWGAENCAAVFDLASSDFENIKTLVIGGANRKASK